MGNSCACTDDCSGTVVEQEPIVQQQCAYQQSYFADEDDGKKTEKPSQETAPFETDKVKPEATSSPAEATSCEFTITLTRKDCTEPWGLAIRKSLISDSLLVVKPAGEPLEKWEKANPSKTLKKYDEVVSVNGVVEADGIIETMNSSTELEIKIRRQFKIAVELTKKGPLGMKIGTATYMIEKITDGMIKSYNKQCPPHLTICKGDQLVAITVNGEAMEMSNDILVQLAKLSEGAEIKLVFSRSSSPAE